MQDRPSFIDIHTHGAAPQSLSVSRIRNVIVGKDDMIDEPCSVGIHPWYIHESGTMQLEVLRKMLMAKPNIVAVGECGLDKVTDTDWKTQETVFGAQLRLAHEYSKPVIIHCVRAFQEVIRLVHEARVTQPILIHGFRKGAELGHQLLQQGFYLSLGASILKGHQDQLISTIPLQRVFIETDTSTSTISEIYMYFCRIRNLSLDQLQKQIWANFEEVFN